MTLRKRLQTDLTDALRSGDELSVSVLRSVIGAVQSAEKGGKTAVVFSDSEIEKLIRQQIKQRTETALIYENAGEMERSKRELAERIVLEDYVEADLSEDEVRVIVSDVIQTAGDVSAKDFGRLMKEIVNQVDGRADGRLISSILKESLN